MNNQIINNLYEFWRHIGNLNNRFVETKQYSAVSMNNSDWPNRIFDVHKNNRNIIEIKRLSKKNKLPEIITITKPNAFYNDPDFEFVFGQKNMALDLDLLSNSLSSNSNIKRVSSEKESIEFADIASESFGYRVDQNVVFKIVKNSESIKLFAYYENRKCLGCGIVFFDSRNNAGLHMIGTIPEGRGKGIGKRMTERLLLEAKEHTSKFCVLHASIMGEPIYNKLGFKVYGEIETYRIIKNEDTN